MRDKIAQSDQASKAGGAVYADEHLSSIKATEDAWTLLPGFNQHGRHVDVSVRDDLGWGWFAMTVNCPLIYFFMNSSHISCIKRLATP